MIVKLQVFDLFGAFCVDAALATQIRSERVDIFLDDADQIIFDFQGVRNMNSSFCNALIANLVARHPECLARIKFANCRSNLKVLIQSAVDLGLERVQNQVTLASQESQLSALDDRSGSDYPATLIRLIALHQFVTRLRKIDRLWSLK